MQTWPTHAPWKSSTPSRASVRSPHVVHGNTCCDAIQPHDQSLLSATAGEGKTPEGGAHSCDEETHHHSQHHGSHRPTLARISDRLTKHGVLLISHQNADRASSTHRNNWLSLVWLRPRGFELKLCRTPFHQPIPEYSVDSSNSTPHRTLKPMPPKIQHPCRHTAQKSNSKIFFRICH